MATRTRKATTPAAPASRESVVAQVVAMRNDQLLSWAAIGKVIGTAPRTVRRMYQEAQGAHSHHGLLPGKGGRLPAGFVTTGSPTLAAGTVPTWQPRTEVNPLAGTKGAAVVAPAAKVPAKRTRKAPASK